MPRLVLIAGPNGAGKTNFARQYLPVLERDMAFVNADEIAREMRAQGFSQAHADIRSGRAMLERIEQLIGIGADLTIETTLASLSYAQKIPAWRRLGYRVALIYLRLPNPERSVERVRRRVAAGGHGVPEEVIRQRFAKSVEYLETRYKPIVDEWYIVDSLEGGFELAEWWNDS